MEVRQEMPVILPLAEDLVMAEELEFQEVEELVDDLMGVPEVMDPQGMGNIHQDEDHQEEEEDLLAPWSPWKSWATRKSGPPGPPGL